MRSTIKILPGLLLLLFCRHYASAQDASNAAVSPPQRIHAPLPTDSLSPTTIKSYLTAAEQKSTTLTHKLEKANTGALKDLTKQEQKLRKKLFAKDSSLAKRLFDNAAQQMGQLTNKLKQNADPLNTSKYREYLPFLDTMKTSLKFLDGNKTIVSNDPLKGQTTKALSSVKGLETQLQNATDIKKYLKQRKQELKDAFEKNGIGKELNSLNKQSYYYSAQVAEYKSLLKDRKKLENKAIAELRKQPLFKDFMAKNGKLAELFKVPDNYGTPQALAGLQTRASVNQLLQGRLGSLTSATGSGGGINPQQYLQQQVQTAQKELGKLKDKAAKLGTGSYGDAGDIPDFKPNSQKTKSFLKRLEYGFNIQSQRPNGLLPVTSDIAATIGYKLSDNATIGTGLAYKLGWGNGFKDIQMTNQGIGLRSYFEWKIPPLGGRGAGNIWLTGGYEKNWTPELGEKLEALNLQAIKPTSWQSSGLIGLTKKFSSPVGGKGAKTTNIQLLYDFLATKQLPKTQELKFRVGWVL